MTAVENTAAPQPPLNRLRALFAEGRLVKEFRAAAAPLSEMSSGETAVTDLVRAGRLLSRLDAEEVLRAICERVAAA